MSRDGVAERTVRIVALLLPSPQRRVMSEIWLSDLAYADELGIKQRHLVFGALLFVLRCGPAVWKMQRWSYPLGLLLIVAAATALTPAWLLLLTLLVGIVAWLALSPVKLRPEGNRSP